MNLTNCLEASVVVGGASQPVLAADDVLFKVVVGLLPFRPALAAKPATAR